MCSPLMELKVIIPIFHIPACAHSDEDPPLDTILAICTIWWIRDSYPSSIWAYADFLETGISALHNDPKYNLDKKPFGFSSFKEEISATPEAWAGRNGNLQFYRYHDKVRHSTSRRLAFLRLFFGACDGFASRTDPAVSPLDVFSAIREVTLRRSSSRKRSRKTCRIASAKSGLSRSSKNCNTPCLELHFGVRSTV